ncbi:MAG: GrpB family protein, partial [Duncaniella dubosii]
TAKEYEALKLSLLPKFKHNRDGYTEAKTEFIERIVSKRKN